MGLCGNLSLALSMISREDNWYNKWQKSLRPPLPFPQSNVCNVDWPKDCTNNTAWEGK